MSAQVINFAAALNARRVEAILNAQEQAIRAKLEAERAALTEKLGGTVAAEFVADVLVSAKAKADERSKTDKFMPAYCDPKNDVRGSKYEATRGVGVAEIAARIRADIKAAQAAGTLPKCKISVRSESYSGGCSVDVRVKTLPAGYRVTSEKYASWLKQFGEVRNPPMPYSDYRSAEVTDLLAKLSAIMAAYNRDNSDSSVDYFDRRFYGDAAIDWELSRDMQRAEVEASLGTYWAE